MLRNGTYVPGVYDSGNLLDPAAIAYDNHTDQYFVTGATTNNVAVFNATTDALVASISVGSLPQGLAYDWGTSQMFVINSFSDNVSVVDDRTDRVVASVGVGSNPYGAVYDPVKGEVFVANQESDNVSVISDALDTVVATVTISTLLFYGPLDLAFDNATDQIYASDQNGVSVISDSRNVVIDTIATSGFPSTFGIAYDSGTNQVFVADEYGDNVSVISPVNWTVVALIGVGAFPGNLAYDPSTGSILVPNRDSNNLSVLSDTTDSVRAIVNETGRGYASPTAVAVDPAAGVALVSNTSNDSLMKISLRSATWVGDVQVGELPGSIAVDAVRGELDIPSYDSSRLLVLNASSPALDDEVPVGLDPYAAVVDPVDHQLFVSAGTQFSPGEVEAMNDSTLATIATIPVGVLPETLSYDPAKGEVIFPYDASNKVGLIDAATDTVRTQITVGGQPYGVAYDPAHGQLFVANLASDDVSVVNDTTDHVVATIGAGTEPLDAVYDPGVGEVFVSNLGSSNVSVINDTTDKVVATIALGPGPTGLAYVPAAAEVFVESAADDLLYGISDSTNAVVSSVTVGVDPYALAYDASTGLLYTANAYGGTVTVVAPGNGAAPPKVDSFDAVPPSIALGSSTTLEVVATDGPLSLTYSFLGLPAGCISANASDLVCTPTSAGAYPIRVYANDSFGESVSAVTNLTVHLTTYLVAFSEVGLPPGTRWSVNLAGPASISSTTSINSLELPNGSYSYSVGSYDPQYRPNPSSGAVVVNGTGFDESVVFLLVPFPVTFSETGLAEGTRWYVNVSGAASLATNSSSLEVDLANGTYAYQVVSSDHRFRPSTAPGTLVVAGAAVSVSTAFVPVTYSVEFVESGLPTGTSWGLAVGNDTEQNSTNKIIFSESNGTYRYAALLLPGWSARQGAGTVTVHGSNPGAIQIEWTPFTYAVTLSETGLPSDATWGATIGPSSSNTSMANLTISLPNGTYSLTLYAPAGYTSNSVPSEIRVVGAAVGLSANFTAVAVNGESVSEPVLWGLAAGVAIAIAVAAIVLIRRRRPPVDSEPSTSGTPPA